MRIDAVLIETSDLEGLAAFYRSAFGLGEPSHVQPDHLGFTLENTYLGFERVAVAADAPRARTSIWFRVTDARAEHARLLDAGARDEMAPDSASSPGETLAVVLDPEGNRIGLLSTP